ncbi:MAG TPA: iron ABC transporter permease [Puia sp.]
MKRGLLILLLVISVVLAGGIGAMRIQPVQVLTILLNQLGWKIGSGSYTPAMEAVLMQIRLPRICLGILTGGGLAIAGASLQGLFRNPLVDPGLVGISSGASLAAVSVIVVLAGWAPMKSAEGHYVLNLATFGGACVSSVVVFRMARVGGKTLVATLLLAGLAINALCNALTGLVTYTADNEQLRSITFWLMGSLGGASWSAVLSILPFVLLPVWLLPGEGRALNVYALGEAEALHMGVDVRWMKFRILLLTTLAVGATVAVCGIIGFIGLIVPHILRSWTGADHRRLLIDSALAGAILVTLADMVSRTLIAPAELPIGIVTALVGTPVFIFLLYRQKKELSI